MSRRYYSNQRFAGDPKMTTAKFDSYCHGCGHRIETGQTIFFWPRGRNVYCLPCGEPEFRRFQSAAADEEVYHGAGNPL